LGDTFAYAVPTKLQVPHDNLSVIGGTRVGFEEESMLFGTYFHQTDVKGRVRIPPKFKDALGQVMVTKGSDGCLFLFSSHEFKTQLGQKLSTTDLFDQTGNNQLRQVFSTAFELEEDAQGRVLLPKALRELAKIEKDIVFIGVGNRAELWAKEKWEAYNEI